MALLVIATFAAYLPAWNGTPIWDDDAHLTRPELRSLEGLTRIWVEPGATQQYYPLIHSLFWLEHHLWGDWPAGYHWLNIVLHCASALLLVRILQALEIPGAWLAGAIFALHPIQAESVAWISELKNMLSGVFYFGSMLAYLKFDRTRNRASYIAALILFLLGLLSKTVIATLPGAILVIFWWKRGKLSWKKDLLPLIPFFLLGTAAGLMTACLEQSLIGAKGSEYHYSIVERILIAGRVIWFYLGKLFWPLDLTFIYPRWQISQNIWWQYLFPASVLVLLASFGLVKPPFAGAARRSAFFCRNPISRTGVYECLSLSLFPGRGPFPVPGERRDDHAGGSRNNLILRTPAASALADWLFSVWSVTSLPDGPHLAPEHDV